eukprot:gene12287-15441_t
MKKASDLLGWTDAFVDRMLMSVVHVREAVEQSRFDRNPMLLDNLEEEPPKPGSRQKFQYM